MLGYDVSLLLYWLRFGLTGGSLITNRSPGFNSDTSIRDEMHCIALVLDATKIPAKGTPLHAKILELKEQIDARGMDLPFNFSRPRYCKGWRSTAKFEGVVGRYMVGAILQYNECNLPFP